MPTTICSGLPGYPCGRAFVALDPKVLRGGKLCPTCRILRARIGNRAKAQQQGFRRMSRR